jgi:hypothetical protein
MTEAEKELTRDVVAWFVRDMGLGRPPIKGRDVRFLEPGLTDEYERDDFALSPSRWRRVAAYGAVHGLAAAGLAMLWAGWFDPAFLLFLALLCALLWFVPILAGTLRERGVLVFYGPGLERELAHQVALAYHNRTPVRECLHAFFDALLFPLALSWQEGLAAWFAARYLESRGQEEEPGTVPLRARNGRRLAWLVGRLFGPGALRFLLLRT